MAIEDAAESEDTSQEGAQDDEILLSAIPHSVKSKSISRVGVQEVEEDGAMSGEEDLVDEEEEQEMEMRASVHRAAGISTWIDTSDKSCQRLSQVG